MVKRDNIRNVCLLAHGSAGKTSIAEAMCFNAGAGDRLGKVEEGTTITDFDPEEIKRRISINTSLASLNWKEKKFNIIDTPGYFDFVGEIMQGIRVADSAVIVADGKAGVAVGTENSWRYCNERKLPRLFFINKLDDDRANFDDTMQQLTDIFGKSVVPFQLPIIEKEHVAGYVDVLAQKAYKYEKNKLTEMAIPADLADAVEDYRNSLMELVAETDEALMEKFFEGESFTPDEITKAIRSGIASCDIAPVCCGSALANTGVSPLMDIIAEYCPSPDNATKEVTTDGKVLEMDGGELSILVFKTVADPFVGKISYFRVYAGELKHDTTLVNTRTGDHEKIAHMFFLCGKKQTETPSIVAGDIGAITKLQFTKTGDTLSKLGSNVTLKGFDFPKPNLSLAINPKAKGDEEKIANGLHKLMDEDLTFNYTTNLETHQQIISGLGESHLDVLCSKLKTKFGVAVELTEPRVPYREAIRKKVFVEGKHKKQSGGHGQYGHVKMEFEPGEKDELEFSERVFGGSVPRNYFPAVEKGLQDCIVHGVLAGYPVVGLKATLVDGSYHPVDSSEMAFKLAASIAYKKGMEEASPVLLEPIGHLEVLIPDSYMGDVIGDINKRRGRVLGMNPQSGGIQQVVAEVPMAAMHKYATDLRSMSHGRGEFSFTFERYEDAPANVAQKVIEETKKLNAESK